MINLFYFAWFRDCPFTLLKDHFKCIHWIRFPYLSAELCMVVMNRIFLCVATIRKIYISEEMATIISKGGTKCTNWLMKITDKTTDNNTWTSDLVLKPRHQLIRMVSLISQAAWNQVSQWWRYTIYGTILSYRRLHITHTNPNHM